MDDAGRCEADLRNLGLWSLAVAATLAGMWAFDLAAMPVRALTTFRGQEAASPLYAFWMPRARPTALLFPAAVVGMILLAPRLADARRTTFRRFLAVLAAASLLLPYALFLVRDRPQDLGRQFLTYRGEEYYEDARGIRDLRGFVARYVELTPRLSSHGRTHPPGNAVGLHLAGRVLGPSPLAAGCFVLGCFAAGLVACWRSLAAALGEAEARVAALLALASPSLLDFACTSMDAVFFAAAWLALWPGMWAFRRDGRPRHALLAGAALFAAMFFSFSAFPVGLFLLVFGVAQSREIGPKALWRLGLVFAAFVGAAVLFALVTGFEIWQCFAAARAEHQRQMTHFLGRRPSELYGYLIFGNALAFLVGAGLALTPRWAMAAAKAAAARRLPSILVATLATLAVLCAGGIYTLEVERIWMFAVPWLAAAPMLRPGPGALRLALGLGCGQALIMEALLFTLW